MIYTPVNTIIQGDAKFSISKIAPKSVNTIMSSPPYYNLRNYLMAGQIGLERTPKEYVAKLVEVFMEAREVLADDGTLWLNIADSYAAAEKNRTAEQAIRKSTLAGSKGTQISCSAQNNKIVDGLKPKDLIGIPWMVAIALRDAGWYLRQSIIWNKPNTMPESVLDRCTKSHEYIFMFSKSKKYYYDAEAIKQPIKESSVQRMARAISDKQKYSSGAGEGQKSHGLKQPKPNENKVHNVIGGNKHKNMDVPGQQLHTIHRTRNSNGTEWDNESGLVNMRDVWNYNSPYATWEWLFANYPEEVINPMWEKYFLDAGYKSDVWTITTKPFKDAHFAAFPYDIPYNCIMAGCVGGGVVLDPFFGAGTTGLVARKLNRNFIGIELNPDYISIAEKRLRGELGLFY